MLWRGPPLAEFAYEPFAQAEIARLEELRIIALEELIEVELSLGRHAEVVGEVEALIAEHPYRERLRALLMLALYRSDRQAEALQVYQGARRKLVDELGIEPGQRLRDLERAILAQDPALAPASAESAATKPAAQVPAIRFVGRECELDELIAGLEDARAGRGRLFVLVGEPGIGKSRLTEELMAHAEARGMRVLTGRCWEAGGAPAYWPWTQALSALAQGVEPEMLRGQLAHDGAELLRLIPELRERLPELPDPKGSHGEGDRFRLLAAVAAFLRSCASSKPLAISLDDLHAADEPSLLLLRFVVRQLADSAILIVGCCRDTEIGTTLAATLTELTREPVTRRIALRGLGAADTSRLLGATIGREPADELAAQVHAETDGNPFFATEIGRLLRPEHLGPDANPALPIPETVKEAVARRLERQSESCRQTLALASVIGREFDHAVVEALSGAEEEAYARTRGSGLSATGRRLAQRTWAAALLARSFQGCPLREHPCAAADAPAPCDRASARDALLREPGSASGRGCPPLPRWRDAGLGARRSSTPSAQVIGQPHSLLTRRRSATTRVRSTCSTRRDRATPTGPASSCSRSARR